MNRFTYFFSTLFVLFITACSHAPKKVGSEPVERVVIESSQIFNYYSAIKDYNYRIKVSFPSSYNTDSNKAYPVILKLDGQWDFPLAAGAYNCVYFDGQMPETIIVGIGWGDVTGDIHAIRSRDLMPSPIERYSESGQAQEFVEVLAKEIIPELEQRFRLNGQRFLMGTSMSALFATYALLEQPETFDGAISIGADYRSAKGLLLKKIQSYANTDKLSGKRLYQGVGSWDAIVPSVIGMDEALKSAQLSGFKLLLENAPGYGHSSMNLPGYANGYRHMFQRESLSLSKESLSAYVGEYAMSNKAAQSMIVSQNNQGLLVQTPWGETVQLRAKSQSEFYHPGMFLKMRFEGKEAFVETFFGKQQLQKVNK